MRLRNLLVITAVLLEGCTAAPPSTTPEADVQARLFAPVADKAVIYIVRDLGDPFVRAVRIGLDGKAVGETLPNTYLRLEVEPGTHRIASFTNPPAVLELRTGAGRLYYVWQDITTEQMREHSALREVDQTTARVAMNNSTIVAPK